MLCEKCGKNTATTHIHTVINGVVTEKNLCSKCASEEGYSDNGFMNLFSSLFSNSALPYLKSEETCEFCNTSFSEIAKTGKMGCPECYKKFQNELLPYLKRLHGGVKHIGKRAESSKLTVITDDKITKLREKLKELIKDEKFEEAAVIRDEIKQAEGENNE